ncbi:MAG: efflux RND transporter periplasmic adaptor subunit [Planctomycetes bacterium]|nr:efflux RND transporter periplasmic adaptor subunit [Planctomycetota bacterium]
MNKVRLTLQIVLPLVILYLGFLAMSGLASQKKSAETVAAVVPPPLVAAIAVERSRELLTVETQGTVVPRTESNLVAEVSGRLLYVSPNLVNGGFVEAGETLIRIDARDYELAVAQAKLTVAQSERRLEEERADAAVAREEWEALGKGEPSALTLREPQVAEALASVDAARAALEKAKLDLERTDLVAPFPARVREKLVDLGEFVTRGQTLATGYGIDFAEVRLPLPDAELAFLDLPIGTASSASDGPRVTLWADFAGQRRTWQGRIVRTEGEIDPRTRMIVAVAEVADPYGMSGEQQGAPLSVGMFVHADILGRALEDVVVVPRTAMRDGDTLYTVDAENRLHVRAVEIARSGRSEVLVGDGLPDDERVVVSPIEIVTEGMLVRVEGDPDPAAAPPELEAQDDEDVPHDEQSAGF